MPQSILLPDLGRVPITFGLWHVGIGDRVIEGERVAEVLIRGAVIDLPSPVAGTVSEQFARPLDTLHPGQVLGTVVE